MSINYPFYSTWISNKILDYEKGWYGISGWLIEPPRLLLVDQESLPVVSNFPFLNNCNHVTSE